MYNPVLLYREGPYETEEGGLSLEGTRKNVFCFILQDSLRKEPAKMQALFEKDTVFNSVRIQRGVIYMTIWPQSMTSSAPVTQAASSLARYRIPKAISSAPETCGASGLYS